MPTGGVKSGAEGALCWQAAISCGRCSRRLLVSYSGPSPGQPVYRCERPNQMLGLLRYFTFGGLRVDVAIAGELFRGVDPMANGAAMEAEQRYWRESGVVRCQCIYPHSCRAEVGAGT